MEKVVITSAERQQKCRAKNPKKAELAQLKQNIKRQNMKDTDPEKANKINNFYGAVMRMGNRDNQGGRNIPIM